MLRDELALAREGWIHPDDIDRQIIADVNAGVIAVDRERREQDQAARRRTHLGQIRKLVPGLTE